MTKNQNKNTDAQGAGIIFPVLAVISLIIFVMLCWYAYTHFIEQQKKEGAIYVKANNSPFKIQPEDRGGMKVDYKDKKVFDTITGEKENLDSGVKLLQEEEKLSKEDLAKEVERQKYEQLFAMEEDEIEQHTGRGSDEERGEINAGKDDSENTLGDIIQREVEGNSSEDFDVAEVDNQRQQQNAVEATKSNNISEQTSQENLTIIDQGGKGIKEEKTDVDTKSPTSTNSKYSGKPVAKPKSLSFAKAKQANAQQVNDPQDNASQVDVQKQVEKVKDAKSGLTTTKITFREMPKSMANKTINKTTNATISQQSSGYYVQISSHKEISDLEQNWTKFKNKFSSDLSGYGRNVSEAVVRDVKYYRLSFGPFPSKSAASAKCSSLKSRGQDCLVKKL